MAETVGVAILPRVIDSSTTFRMARRGVVEEGAGVLPLLLIMHPRCMLSSSYGYPLLGKADKRGVPSSQRKVAEGRMMLATRGTRDK